MDSKEFLKSISQIRDYWLKVNLNQSNGEDEISQRMDGFIFSLLTMFDGCSGANDFNRIILMDRDGIINKDNVELHNQWHDCN